MAVELGLGLVSLGREWGVHKGQPPSRDDAMVLLAAAVRLGVRFFDTAPAYGASEVLLGEYLAQAGPGARDLTIATKMGEHWSGGDLLTIVDHGYDALRRSLDQSLKRLGRIDLLQIHMGTAENLASHDVLRGVEYARTLGIKRFGASLKTIEALKVACGAGVYGYVQFPFNRAVPELAPAFDMLRAHKMLPIVNRPLAMGAVVADTDSKAQAIAQAFAFVRQHMTDGVILTGTRSSQHLAESVAAF
jgi:aryl-alcohol dehydrogenase-like predicted oxidoreductase